MKKLKVLWFSNTPGLANEYLNKNDSLKTGSWMNLINEKMAELVDLHIIFPGKTNINFAYKNTKYYQIKMHNRNLLQKFRNRIIPLRLDINFIKSKCLKIIKELKPDIIHVFGTELPWGIIQDYVNIPVVISIQGNLTAYVPFYFRGISTIDIIRYSNFRIKKKIYLGFRRFVNNSFIEKKILLRSKYIIGRTDWDRRITRVLAPNSEYYSNEETLRKIFYSEQWKIPNSTTINLFTVTGRVTYKGFETVVKTAILLDKMNLNFKWHIAGLEKYNGIVQILSKKIGLSDNIKFEGIIDEKAIIDLLKISHIYIMPSHIENGSIVLSEAMITGIPVITTLAGGTSSRLQDGKEGLMIQPGDPYSLAGSIIETMNKYNNAIKMGKLARQKALKRHNTDTIRNQLLGIYKQVIINNK